MEHFEKKNGNFWEKNGTFWEKSGAKKKSGRALCEKPTDLDPLFARQSKQKKKEKIHPPLDSPLTLGPTILQV